MNELRSLKTLFALSILLWFLTDDGSIVIFNLFSIVFQFYHVRQFYCSEKPEYPEKTIALWQVTENMYQIKLYRVHLAMSRIRTHSVSGDKH